MSQEPGRVHRTRSVLGEVEEWVECSVEEWERAEPADRRMLGLGGLQRFEPVRVRRARAEHALPLWDVLSANDVWLVLKVPAANVLEAIPEGMSGLSATVCSGGSCRCGCSLVQPRDRHRS